MNAILLYVRTNLAVVVVLILTRVKKRFADSEVQKDAPQEQNDKDKSE